MRRIYIFILFLFSLTNIAIAQKLKERRVYYVDCSYSMKQNGIWNLVRDNLKEAIDDVEDETTELLICPYAYDNTSSVKTHKEFATESGKKKLKSIVDNLPMTNSTKTYHEMPLRDFYNNKVDPKRVTYVFFMTDGVSDHIVEDKNHDPFPQELKSWHTKFADKYVYGFYVMLHESAAEYKGAMDVIGSNENQRKNHLWAIESANVNVNLVRLNQKAVFNARTEQFFDIPIFGKHEGKEFSAKFSPNPHFIVEKTSIINGKLRVYVKVIQNVYALPATQRIPLELKLNGGDAFDFLINERIVVECLSKPEKTLKISVR